MNWAWRLRSFMDAWAGGVGARRGKQEGLLETGDIIDFWRVESIEPDRLMRLRAEMKLPGEGWLEFKVQPDGDNHSRLTQTAYFAPGGIGGLLYWYSLYPIHELIFTGLIIRIAERAERREAGIP